MFKRISVCIAACVLALGITPLLALGATGASSSSAILTSNEVVGAGEAALSAASATAPGKPAVTYEIQYAADEYSSDVATIAWEPASSGGAATSYTLTVTDPAGTADSYGEFAADEDLTCDVPLLSGYGTYEVTVTATNAAGSSATTCEVSYECGPVLSVKLSSVGVLLTWTAPSDGVAVESYAILRSGPYDATDAIATVASTKSSYTDKTASAGDVTYYVIAKTADGYRTSNAATITLDDSCVKCSAPTLTATTVSEGILLSWTRPATGTAQRYFIEYRDVTEGQTWSLSDWTYSKVGANIQAYVYFDESKLGHVLEFRLAGKNSVGIGAFSEIASATMPEQYVAPTSIPDMVSASLTEGEETLTLTWDAPDAASAQPMYYHITKYSSANTASEDIYVAAPATQWVDTDVVPHVEYRYVIAGVNAAGECTKYTTSNFVYGSITGGCVFDDGVVTTAPTCTTAGVKTYTCKYSSSHTYTESIPATGHSWDNGTITTAPTCTAVGVKTYTCKNDSSHTYTESVAATGHVWDSGTVTKAPTCTTAGVKTYTCKNDSSHTKTATIAATGHKWDNGTVTKAATCEEDGVLTYTCKNNSSHTYTVSIAATGHDWDEGVVTKAATCTEDGVITYTCKNDPSHTYTESIPATGHVWDSGTVTTAPSCEAAGVLTYTCKNDSAHTYTVAYGSATGHSWDNGVVTTTPTCQDEGVITYTCKNNSSHTYTASVAAIGHDWDDGVITKAATCEDEGVITYTCKNDPSHTYTESIPATGHVWDSGTVTTEPTCTTSGVKTYTCKNDPSHTKTTSIAATGHDWDEGVVTKAATCTTSGTMTYTCKNDPSHTKTASIARLGGSHSWGSWTQTVAPTDETTGIQQRTCSRCGATQEKTVAAYTGVEAFAYRLYADILDREPDDSGFQAQVKALKAGTAPAEIAYNFFNSYEYFSRHESNEHAVLRVYHVMFGREPDESGFKMWLGKMDDGMSVRAVVAGFSQASEYRTYFGSLGLDNAEIPVYDSSADKAWSSSGKLVYSGGNSRDLNQGAAAFAKRMYTVVLGRDDSVGTDGGVDVSGLNAQAGAIANGYACWKIAVNFFTSSEFNGRKLSNSSIVDIAYRAILGREADASGRAHWVAKLNTGMDPSDLVKSFCGSSEFEEICDEYGLESGM